jgi:hypothetical protein
VQSSLEDIASPGFNCTLGFGRHSVDPKTTPSPLSPKTNTLSFLRLSMDRNVQLNSWIIG